MQKPKAKYDADHGLWKVFADGFGGWGKTLEIAYRTYQINRQRVESVRGVIGRG